MMISTLIVDDSALMRQYLRQIIEQNSDMEVLAEASDGVLALEAIRRHRPDVLLLNIEMPRLDGVEVVRRLRLISRAEVVIVSSAIRPDSPKVRALLALGVSEFIQKPSGALSLDIAEARGEQLIAAVRRLAALHESK